MVAGDTEGSCQGLRSKGLFVFPKKTGARSGMVAAPFLLSPDIGLKGGTVLS